MSSRRQRSKVVRQRMKIALIIVAVAALLGAAYWLSKSMGPAQTGNTSKPVAIDEGELSSMRDRVHELRTEFALRERSGNAIQPEDLELLTKAIELQVEINKALNAVGKVEERETLERMRHTRDSIAAEPLINKSDSLEAEGRNAMSTGNYGEAYEKLQEAAMLQEEINREYPDSGHFDASRVSRLRSQFQKLGLRPLHNRSVDAENAGETAFAEGNYKEALQQFEKALEIQREIIQQDRTSAYADIARVRRLEKQLVDLKASAAANEADKLKKQANAALENEDYDKAMSLAREALNRQQALSRTYTGSRYSTSERSDEFRTLVDSVASARLANEIAETAESMQQALRERRTGAAMELASEALRKVQEIRSEYPQSRFLEEDRNLNLRFLTLLGGDLASLQESFYANLTRIPGMPEKRMYTREIPQFLYNRLVGSNPSSHKGESLPVESLTWHEAQEFAQKLSWMLGYPVRLPTEAEFQAALGDPQSTVDHAWTSQNSDREIQPVNGLSPNANGFFHLLGNVSEWLQDSPRDVTSQALVIGGSSRDNPIRLGEVPVQTRDKTERNRYTGFRVVVLFGAEESQ